MAVRGPEHLSFYISFYNKEDDAMFSLTHKNGEENNNVS